MQVLQPSKCRAIWHSEIKTITAKIKSLLRQQLKAVISCRQKVNSLAWLSWPAPNSWSAEYQVTSSRWVPSSRSRPYYLRNSWIRNSQSPPQTWLPTWIVTLLSPRIPTCLSRCPKNRENPSIALQNRQNKFLILRPLGSNPEMPSSRLRLVRHLRRLPARWWLSAQAQTSKLPQGILSHQHRLHQRWAPRLWLRWQCGKLRMINSSKPGNSKLKRQLLIKRQRSTTRRSYLDRFGSPLNRVILSRACKSLRMKIRHLRKLC